MALQLLPLGAWQADALSFPWTGAGKERSTSSPASGSFSGLQEVAPPPAVQQLQAALADREPVVEILSPGDDALLGSGPWTLRLQVHDWPLVDGGDLGLGPHLVVQLDQEPPRIWTKTEGELPELSPGSHRLTVYAALPWGEARKNPGAVRQIRLHRTAPNPLALPAAGSPQLLAVSPAAIGGEEPLLLDVLLLNAPLQNVGGSGTQWRLRVNVNGDGVLLDEQTPLWLRGWKPGVNAVRLEWLDGKGDPLNPPFNSLVQEVDRSNPPPLPRWRGTALSERELAILLGLIPADPRPAPEPSAQQSPTRENQAAPLAFERIDTGRSTSSGAGPGQATSPGSPSAPASATPDASEITPASGLTGATVPGEAAEPKSAALIDAAATLVVPSAERGNQAERIPPGTAGRQQNGAVSADAPVLLSAQTASGAASDADREAPRTPMSPVDEENSSSRGMQERSVGDSAQPQADPSRAATSPSRTPGASPSTNAGPPSSGPLSSGPLSDAGSPDSGELTRAPEAAEGGTTPTPDIDAAEIPVGDNLSTSSAGTSGASQADGRISPSSPLSGRARDLVNEDGTLKRPERRGPLAALRDRLQR